MLSLQSAFKRFSSSSRLDTAASMELPTLNKLSTHVAYFSWPPVTWKPATRGSAARLAQLASTGNETYQ